MTTNTTGLGTTRKCPTAFPDEAAQSIEETPHTMKATLPHEWIVQIMIARQPAHVVIL